MGAVSGIVGAGGNVGAVLAGFLFTSETISYRESLFTIGIAVILVAFISLALSASKTTSPDAAHVEAKPKLVLKEPVLGEAIA
jgi:nitrate/nitrite transporter NarK